MKTAVKISQKGPHLGLVAIPSRFMKMLPKWLTVSGFVIALAGVLSSFYLIIPNLLYLIPLTRFPGFIWLIMAGFKLSGKEAAQVFG